MNNRKQDALGRCIFNLYHRQICDKIVKDLVYSHPESIHLFIPFYKK